MASYYLGVSDSYTGYGATTPTQPVAPAFTVDSAGIGRISNIPTGKVATDYEFELRPTGSVSQPAAPANASMSSAGVMSFTPASGKGAADYETETR